MIVTRLYEPAIAQASYLIGCAATGEALVIDPNRDVDQYIEAAGREGLRVAHVTETHIHADFVSGARELAARTGARLYLSDEGDADWKYGFAREGTLIRNGDRIAVGRIQVEAVATPGHTPEHLAFLITDTAAADAPIAAATGDFIFVGDVGRPDLLERAANIKGTMEIGARALWKSLEAFKRRDDWLQIWPGHGAGSACGKGISAVPYSTLGYERRFNWAFKVQGEEAFVRQVLAGQPEPPRYFATMKRVNKTGPESLGGFRVPARLDDAVFDRLVAAGATVVDTRSAADFAAAHVPRTLSIPLTGSFVTWAGWLLPYTEDLYFIVDDLTDEAAVDVVRRLALIGLDRVGGLFDRGVVERAARRGVSMGTIRQMSAADLARHPDGNGFAIIDVRSESEWRAGHLPAATHIPLGYLSDRLAEVPLDRPVVLQCQSGNRSSIAASLLARLGRSNVVNLAGGLDACRQTGLPVAPEVPA
jgi:hydroxyacylglutathione hydrolase